MQGISSKGVASERVLIKQGDSASNSECINLVSGYLLKR